MSFITPEDIYETVEGLVKRVYKAARDYDLPTPSRRMTYAEAMRVTARTSPTFASTSS